MPGGREGGARNGRGRPVNTALLPPLLVYLDGLPVSFAVYSRALVPSYLFQRSVLAWECSVCRKMFCLTLDEAERVCATSPPEHIGGEFRLHCCEIVLLAAQQKHDQASMRPLSVELRKTSKERRQS